MKITYSIFPKFYKHLGVEQLAELIRRVGLDTTNLVIREGYWVDPKTLAVDVPKFVRAMEAAGIAVTFATAGYSPDEIVFDPTPLKVLADNGITQFRMSYFRMENPDVRVSYVIARHKLQAMLERCAEAKIRAIYQVHHGTLVSSASAAFGLINGLDPQWIGVELDPGNQAFEGYERWEVSVGLMGEYLRAVGIKDTAITRDPARAAEPGKGWTRTWATLMEGDTNWYDLLRALKAGNFEGHFVWMPFYDENDPAEMTRKLTGEVAYMRRVAAEVEAEPPPAAP